MGYISLFELMTQENLLRWYKINTKLPMTKENKFWLNWEKNYLFVRKMLKLCLRN